jgi:hypothetical protein
MSKSGGVPKNSEPNQGDRNQCPQIGPNCGPNTLLRMLAARSKSRYAPSSGCSVCRNFEEARCKPTAWGPQTHTRAAAQIHLFSLPCNSRAATRATACNYRATAWRPPPIPPGRAARLHACTLARLAFGGSDHSEGEVAAGGLPSLLRMRGVSAYG